MKHKVWLLFCLGGMVCAGFVAYHAGANVNTLSAQQTHFDHLQSAKNNNTLTQTMRNALLRQIAYWVQNHESRISALASDKTATKLTSEQMNFDKYLSSRHENKLTSGMRDNTLKMLTIAATNHEDRLRQAEVLCQPKEAPKPKVGSCQGSYVASTRSYCGTKKQLEVVCLERRSHVKLNSIISWNIYNDMPPVSCSLRKEERETKNLESCSYQRKTIDEIISDWGGSCSDIAGYSRYSRILQQTFACVGGQYTIKNPYIPGGGELYFEKDYGSSQYSAFNTFVNNLPTSIEDVRRICNAQASPGCESYNNNQSSCNSDPYCIWKTEATSGDCSQFSKSACGSKQGCQRVEN